MPSLRCVSRVECAYQRQACKQQHASQSYDCNKVKFDKSGQNGDVCEATQLQADCEAAEAIWPSTHRTFAAQAFLKIFRVRSMDTEARDMACWLKQTPSTAAPWSFSVTASAMLDLDAQL